MIRAFVALLFLFCSSAGAQDLYMVRSQLGFPEAMAALQQSIKDQGYKVSRVQRVDIGLKKMGFKTDKYRVVFFGKLAEVHKIVAKYPDLIPYVPLKIAIFAEGDETLLLAASFGHLRPFFKQPELQGEFDRWQTDIRAILERVRKAQ